MASSSSSSSSSSFSKSRLQWIYDVFINFRGEDTRKNFVSHLYSALANAGVNTFLDDEKLPKGQELKSELFKAIEGSQISIVVFSQQYIYSSWCLDELVKIMECRRNHGQVVLPIFYYVQPSNVRHQKGSFGEALEALAERRYPGKEMEYKLARWKSALNQAANLHGWDVMNYRSDYNLVKEIVTEVEKKLDNGILSVTEFPVGLVSRVQQVIKFIADQSSKVCVVGIWGMGGSGKTTTAKAIYNQIHRYFVDKCFIESIREVCEVDSRGKILLQEKILSDVLKTKVNVCSIASGTTMIENRLHGKRALIVLDDVNKFEQLKALCGNRKWIGEGSVIIITTRDVRLLNVFKVDYVYEMVEMNKNESLELFSWHAFRVASPAKDFVEYSRNVVAYCGGLPLALEVLGSYLFERTKQEWQNVLSKLERIPNDQVQEILRISYDGLDDEEKNILLDICFFFIGKDRAYVTEILNGCGLHAEIGITILVERSLIKVEKNNKLRMHDLLRDMGREIVRQSSPQEPEKRSRLWVHEDVLDVLAEHTGTKAIEGLALKLQGTSRFCFDTKAFEKMKRLRLLQLNHVQLLGDYEYLPKQLRWLYWKEFSLNYIPDNFYQGNVVSVELKYSNIKLVWKEPQLLERLKYLNLSHCKYLISTPDFSKLPNLERLILKNCPSLSEVHQSIGDLCNILLINLRDCTSISNLPRSIYQLKSLKTLILSGCSKIDQLEEDIGQMESLTTLIADNTSVKQVPFSIVRLKSIGYISLCGYEGLSLNVFPSIIWSWMSPSMSPLSRIHPIWGMSSSLVYMNVQNNELDDPGLILSNLSKLRSVSVQCNTEIQLSKELRTILDNINCINYTEFEIVSRTSQISKHSLRSYLIVFGSCQEVFNTLNMSIAKGFETNESSDVFLPGDNYPYWLSYTGEGHSVFFIVPEDRDCCIRGMTLCVVFSSTPENTAAECLISVLMVNYTKCTVQIYKRDTVISTNDEDWEGIISNLGAGDNVEIFVAFGYGLIVKKIAVYLIYDQSITMKMELAPYVTTDPSPTSKMELSPEVKKQPSPNVTKDPSPTVKTEQPLIPKKNIYEKLTMRMRECLCLNWKVVQES